MNHGRLPVALPPTNDKLPRNFVDNAGIAAIFVVIRLGS